MDKLKKIRIESIDEYKGEVIKVYKNDFEIIESLSITPYYGIALKSANVTGGEVVFGWDSGWEDSYDKELMKTIYHNWDGYLYWEEDRYLIRA